MDPGGAEDEPARRGREEIVARAARGSRRVVIDGLEYFEVYRLGALQGWGVVCTHHGRCTKTCAVGTGANRMSDAECQRRLRRWEAGGAAVSQEAHASAGGVRLINFAD